MRQPRSRLYACPRSRPSRSRAHFAQLLPGRAELFLEGSEAAYELRVGLAEGEFGVDAELPGEAGQGEDQVAELFLYPCGVRIADRGFELTDLFPDLGQDAVGVRPVESAGGDPPADQEGREEGRGRRSLLLEDGGTALFRPLPFLPGIGDAGCGEVPRLSEDVRVAGDHLGVDPVQGVGDGERPLLLVDARQEDDFHQDVPELLGQPGGVVGLEGVDGLIDLFKEMIPDVEGGPGLIPRASARAAQGPEDPHQLTEFLTGAPDFDHGSCP